MSIRSFYQRVSDYLAAFLALLGSCVVALTSAILGARILDFLLGKLHGPGDLGDAVLAFFFVASSIFVVGFLSCFALLMKWHRVISWRAPTFALALGVILVWMWGHDWLGIAPFLPGTIAWLLICWLLSKKVNADTEHAVKT